MSPSQGLELHACPDRPRILSASPSLTLTPRPCHYPDLSGVSRGEPRSVALVTGATGAIGRAIAGRIAARPGYEGVLICRDAAKAEAAVEMIRHQTGNPHVRYELADLSRRASINALAERWRSPAHTLINNAAVTPRRREETPEGIELELATNVLGYFWMINAFRDHLAHSAPASTSSTGVRCPAASVPTAMPSRPCIESAKTLAEPRIGEP